MHLSSLPSPYGIGTMGRAARDFLDFLEAAGQTHWQLLPLCPTGPGDSPYQSFSSFAGNPYFIDLDDLAAEGLLLPDEYRTIDWGGSETDVDYGVLYQKRYPVLRLAAGRLLASPPPDFEEFLRDNDGWLPDFCLYMALKSAQDGAPWYEWPRPLRLRDDAALAEARAAHADDVAFWSAVQYLFFAQWSKLRELAAQKGIAIVGDLPIYVSLDSADVWANPQLFQLDDELVPTEVAGVPPDAFSDTGQLWGNPLFLWDAMAADGYRWWVERIRRQFCIFDVLRIDHFRGFDSFYAIPYGAPDAREGRWQPGPGIALFRAVEAALGPRSIIAEDLGYLTESVVRLLHDSGFPGMKVLQFAFGDVNNAENAYLPHNYTPHCVAYIGTHDNDTALGWLRQSGDPAAVAHARDYLALGEKEPHWDMMRALWASVAELTVVQAQDILALGSEGRMNTPSTVGTNWRWRATDGAFTPAVAERLRHAMRLYGRLRKE